MSRISIANIDAFMGSALPVSSGASFLKFTQSGEWLLGRDADVIDPEELFHVDITSFQHGWIGWNHGKLCGPYMVPVDQAPMPEAHLKTIESNEQGDGWKRALAVTLHAEDGVQAYYNASTMGGLKTMRDLLTQVAHKLDSGEAGYPVVSLSSSSYHNKRYKKEIFSPEIIIKSWASSGE